MIYNEGSPNGSESSDSDRNEGKKNGDACEGNVDNSVDNVEYINMEPVDHIRNRFQPNHKYTSCHVFPDEEEGLSGEPTNKFTDDDMLSGISHDHAKADQLMQGLEGSSIDADAANAKPKHNLHGTKTLVSQVNVNNTADNQSDAPTCKYVDISVQIDCWGDEEVSTTSSEFSVETELVYIVDLFSPQQNSEKSGIGELVVDAEENGIHSPEATGCCRNVEEPTDYFDLDDGKPPRSLWGNSNANSPVMVNGKRQGRSDGDSFTPGYSPPRRKSTTMNEPRWIDSKIQNTLIHHWRRYLTNDGRS